MPRPCCGARTSWWWPSPARPAGILRPDEGEVRLGPDRIDAWSPARRAALRGLRLGFVFQFGQLLPELPAVENVALPLMLGGLRGR